MLNIPRKALITGASSGIGEALCYLLAAKGVALVVTGRHEERLNELAQNLQKSVPVTAFTADLASLQGRKRVAEMIHEHMPDLLVNNAGFGLYGEALSHSVQEELEIAEVNAIAVLELTLEAAKAMEKAGKKGTILNVSSAAPFQVFPMLATYSASKAFVNQLSQSLDFEMRSKGIRVLASCPGMVDTGFRKRASGAMDEGGKHFGVMSASFAAEQLWKQVLKGKRLHVFDWKTRLGVFFSSYLLPKAFIAKILSRNIKQRLTD